MSESLSSGDKRCPTCGRDDFESVLGMKLHHSKTHNESLSGHKTNCDYCGKETRVNRERLEEYDHQFCSHSCHSNWRSEQLVGEKHPRWKDNKIELECEYCGDSYYETESRKDRSRFCSRECNGKWHSGERHAQYKRVKSICKYCGDEYEVRPCQSDRTSYCSKDCQMKHRSQKYRGENHPNFKGGSVWYYGANWEEQRRKVLIRDQSRCQSCGKTPVDTGSELHCHHIKRLKWFKENYDNTDWYKIGNDVSNLVMLCSECHGKWEGIELKPTFEYQY